MARLQRRVETPLDIETVRRDVEEWYGVKRQAKFINEQLNRGKETLKKIVQRHGTADPTTGSLFLELDEAVPAGDRKILKLKNQRSVGTSFNEAAAEQILKDKGLWDEMVEMVPVIDEGRIHAAYYDNRITENELSRMFPQSISFSFILLDDSDKPVT